MQIQMQMQMQRTVLVIGCAAEKKREKGKKEKKKEGRKKEKKLEGQNCLFPSLTRLLLHHTSSLSVHHQFTPPHDPSKQTPPNKPLQTTPSKTSQPSSSQPQ